MGEGLSSIGETGKVLPRVKVGEEFKSSSWLV